MAQQGLSELERAVVEAALAIRDRLPPLGDPPEQPDHFCTLGITDCDGTCVDWGNYWSEAHVREQFNRAVDALLARRA